MDPSI
jgi:hypothetical protein